MYISLGTLGALVLVGWLAYVCIPAMEEWSSERAQWKNYDAKKREYEKTHHWDEKAGAGGEWVRNDGKPGD